MATRTILYQRWKPLARLSLIKKVCENTKPCCSSPKKIGPSRPGHTWPYRKRDTGCDKEIRNELFFILHVWLTCKHIHCLPHSWGCARRPGGPHWTAVAVWDAGGSGSVCPFRHRCSQSRGEMQEVNDIPKRRGEWAKKFFQAEDCGN